jgi:hypothetical protein
MRIARNLLLVICLVGFLHPAAAQKPSADDTLETALTHWRAASWYVRLGDNNLTAIEIETFDEEWHRVMDLPPDARPTLHARDPRWTDTVKQIAQLGDDASGQIERSDVAAAAATLAKIGDALAASRKRAGSQGFPEAIRQLGAAVERLHRLLPFEPQRRGASFDDALRAQVSSATDAAVAAEKALPSLVPARWAADAKLTSLLDQNLGGLRNLREALDRKASGLEVAGLLGVVHANYNLLFLGYGA